MIMDKNSDNIQVMVRVRPFNGRERAEDARSCVILDDSRPNCIILDAKPDQKAFNFDWVGGDRTTQQDIFEVVGKAMVHTCLEGYNCCIFAYGQTGAGKTYTMQGRGLEINDEDILNRGLQPRVFDYIFALKAKDMNENPDLKYLVTCSYLEIYNEQIMDLLEPVGGNLQIREDLKKGVYVEGLKEEMVENSEETIELLRKGAINRHVGSTNMNLESSRSHSLFTMSIERKVATNGTIHVRTSKFHFVDLAGSERQQKTAAVGERLKEAGNINKSLSVLGQVINSLVEIAEGKQRHIRYRDSKLTFILKDSLGGNSKTSLIANISPASSSFSETLSTLKFAQRAKQIKNKASINEDLTGSVEGLKNEIRQLKEELSRYKSNMMAIESSTERRTLTPPRITPHSHFGFSLENQRTFLEQNQRFIEVEILLKQSLEVLSENELALQTELAKKEEYINMFRNAVDFYQCNELQYRTVLSLNHVRIERLSKNLSMKIEEIDMNHHYHEEVDHLQKELNYIFEIVRNTPAVMRVYMENVEMRERLDSIEAEMNPTSTVSIARQLQENLILVHQLNQKLEEDINDRRYLMERLERMDGLRDGLTSPEKFRRSEEDLRRLKLEHSQQVEQLNQEIMNLKQRENEAHRILELESKKYGELLRENTFLKEENEKMEERYGKRYNELFKEVEQIHEIRSDPNSLESRLDQLNIKNFELKDQMLSYKDKNEKIMKLYQELEDHLQTALKEKDENERSLREELERAVSEKNILESSVGTLESRMKIITEDLDKYEKENSELTQTLADFYLKENDYKINGETLYQENVQLQERLNNLEDVKNAEIRQLEAIVEKQKVCLETLENDRTKVQEELDTLTQTLNYNVNQLEEKKQLLVELQEKLSEKEKTFEEVQSEFNRQKEYTESLEKQINDENSPYNLALRENVRLHEGIKETLSQVKALEEELHGKKGELEQASFRINELTESTQHYSSAYQDAIGKLEVKANEAKETQAALDSKIAELAQLEQELKASNENTLNKENEVNELKAHLERMTESIHSLEKKNMELDAELQEKKSENEQLAARGEDLQNKISGLEQQIEQMKLSHFNELEQLTNSLMASEEGSNKKSLEIQTLGDKIQEAYKTIEDLRVQNGQMEEENQDLKSSFQKMKEEVECQFQKLNDIIAESTEANRLLQEEKLKALEEIDVQKGEILKRDESLRGLEEEKMKALEEIDVQKEEVMKRDESLRGLEEEKVKALNEVEVQKGEIIKKEESIRVLEEEKTQALTEIEVQKEEISKRDEVNRLLEEEKLKALEEIDVQKGEVTKKEESIKVLEEEKVKALDEINFQKGEIIKRDELLRENDMMLFESTKKIEELQNNLIEVQEEVEKFKNGQEQALNKISELEQELMRREELQRSAEKMIEENNVKIEELQNARAKLGEEVEQLKKEVAEGLSKASELSNEITNQQGLLKLKEENIQENAKHIEGLESQISQTQQTLDEKASMLQEMEQRLSEKVDEISNQVDMIRNLESQIGEKNVQLETLEKNLFESQEIIRDVKNKLEESGSKVADLEVKLVDKQEEMNRKIEELKSENQRELENKANEYSMEIETSRKQTAEVQSELDDLKASIQSDYVTLKDFNQTVAEMQSVLDEERNNVAVQLNTIREEILRDAKEKEEMIEKFDLNEKELEDKIAGLVKETAKFSEEVANSKKKIEELQEKNESLEKDNEKKANEIQEYSDGMSQMKEQIESYGEILKQLEEFNNVKRENEELRISQKKQEEMINYLQKTFTDYYRNQEVEMSRIKESYNKLQEESEFIKSNIEEKEGEILRSNENTRVALQEKENLLFEIKRLKDHEGYYKKAKEEVEEKMNALNNEKTALMTQLNELEKVNSQLAKHNNPHQKIQYMNDLKDEIKKHMKEKTTLQTNLNKSLAKTEQLQKQLEEFAKRHNIDPSKLGTDLREDPDVLIELNKLKIENHTLKDVVFRVNSLLMEGFIHLKSLPQPYNNSKDDFNVTLEHVKDLVKLIKNKEKAKAEREKENNDTRHFDIQLIDKHLEDIRQNYSLALADPEFKAVLQQHAPVHAEHKKNIENKENTNETVVQKPKTKEMNLSKVLAPRPVSGVKRNLESMISSSANKGSSLVDRFGRKPASDISRARKDSTEKSRARASYDKPPSKQKSFLKQNNSIGDITNQELGTKKLKQDPVLQNNNYFAHSQIANK